MMLIALSTMLLTTACSSEDDLVNNTANTENTINKGYALPVTVSATRGGDATRATFDGSKLNFGAGDKLFVSGYYGGSDDKQFAGTLEYDAESGKFSGTIYTEDNTYSTYEDLFGNSDFTCATLLPAGYEDHGYLVIKTNNSDVQYDDYIEARSEYTLATSKADGVAQFSYEQSFSYSDGFALSPNNAILNFTITGFAASTQVAVVFTSITYSYNITGTVTTDAFGTATFAAGIRYDYNNLQLFSLTVDGNPITLPDKKVEAGKIYNITRGTGATVDLSTINSNYTASNGVTLTGTLGANKQISIADGATVILNNVTINGTKDSNYPWAGITCEGDATIILSGTNTVKGFYENYPGIQAAVGKTLIIKGSGSLTASSNGYGVGIGGGYNIACGNIEIQGGTITATGGNQEAGIGSGRNANCGTITISGGTVSATGGSSGAGIGSGDKGTCGNITISGGTVTATGGSFGAGIGSGLEAGCGDITITTGVTKVTATKGSSNSNSIGAGFNGSCGTVTIGGNVGAITTSPYTYQP
jgi:hypothetical protein